MRHRVALSLTVTALLAAFARPAAACWDGFHGETERVRIVGYSDGTWSYAEARRLARWIPRFEALLDDGEQLSMADYQISRCRGGECVDASPPFENEGSFFDPASDLARTFDHLASGLSASERRRALATPGHFYAVQLASFRARADAFAATLTGAYHVHDHERTPPGFYTAGGYHWVKNPAEIVSAELGGVVMHRVVAGVFLDAEKARAYQRHLADHGLEAAILVDPL
ncbi:MAG: SPOR domain-containing protein [Polyangiaceae bacterium]